MQEPKDHLQVCSGQQEHECLGSNTAWGQLLEAINQFLVTAVPLGLDQGRVWSLTWSTLSSGRAGQQPLCHSVHCLATCVALTTWTLTGLLVPWLNLQGHFLDGSTARCQGLMCELFIRAPYLMENPKLLQRCQNKSRCNLPLLQSAPRHVWEWLMQLSISNPKMIILCEEIGNYQIFTKRTLMYKLWILELAGDFP